MSDEFYILESGQQSGPFTSAQLWGRVSSGDITDDVPAFKAGMQDWEPLRNVVPRPVAVAPKATPIAAVLGGSSGGIMITGVDIPFWHMVRLLLTAAVAAIPAAILYAIIIGGLVFVPLALLGGATGSSRQVFETINSQLSAAGGS